VVRFYAKRTLAREMAVPQARLERLPADPRMSVQTQRDAQGVVNGGHRRRIKPGMGSPESRDLSMCRS
jgi:hypothetical protein